MFNLLIAMSVLASVAAFHGYRTTRNSNSLCMTSVIQDSNELKRMVGYKAVDDYVRSGMAVGLGTGSTAYFAIERVGQKIKSGELKDIVCVPSSERTKEQALKLGIELIV
jgi:ribose 5-phosphate isomerase A